MSNKTNLYSFFLATALLTAGCSQDSTPFTPPCAESAGTVQIALSARMAGAALEVTRSYTDKTDFTTGDAIGLLAATDEQMFDPIAENHNRRYTATDATTTDTDDGRLYTHFTATTPVAFYPAMHGGGLTEMYLFAYYPYTDAVVSESTGIAYIPVCSTLCTDAADHASDPLYTGAYKVTRQTPATDQPVAVQTAQLPPFRHALARLQAQVKLTAPTDASHSILLKTLTFTLSQPQTALMSVQNGAIISTHDHALAEHPVYTLTIPAEQGTLSADAPATPHADETLIPGTQILAISATVAVVTHSASPDDSDSTESTPQTIAVYEYDDANPDAPIYDFNPEQKRLFTIKLSTPDIFGAAGIIDGWGDTEEVTPGDM